MHFFHLEDNKRKYHPLSSVDPDATQTNPLIDPSSANAPIEIKRGDSAKLKALEKEMWAEVITVLKKYPRLTDFVYVSQSMNSTRVEDRIKLIAHVQAVISDSVVDAKHFCTPEIIDRLNDDIGLQKFLEKKLAPYANILNPDDPSPLWGKCIDKLFTEVKLDKVKLKRIIWDTVLNAVEAISYTTCCFSFIPIKPLEERQKLIAYVQALRDGSEVDSDSILTTADWGNLKNDTYLHKTVDGALRPYLQIIEPGYDSEASSEYNEADADLWDILYWELTKVKLAPAKPTLSTTEKTSSIVEMIENRLVQ